MSPENSPHKQGKNGPKRQRTVTVNSLVPTVQTNFDTLPSPQLTLTFESFLENIHEANKRIALENKLFSYIIQKYGLHFHHHTDIVPTNAVISDVRVFLDDNRHCDLQRTSAVHYMELLDENPDCAETMSVVAEDLLAKFDGIQDGWVVLVGDGKTYRHL